ncbi:MAG: ABC transporter ATP-binding protein [Dehalococcoidia bacterium]|nr:ABC transporter ATP-binding protein [Dehalococcoidia bacterium]MDD5493421.1 ABC transporter ATP-binding protein [Dehalococcoidia bacterium]
MIRLVDLVKIYEIGDVKVQALDHINLNIEAGEMVSIMGPSGSGKSTMMNILGCLDRPSSGKYILDGIDVSSMTDNQLANIRNKKIGFVFQSFNLLPRLNAILNVELPLIYIETKNRRTRAMKALELVGIAQRAGHKPSEMSGGEQQRVAIARALVNNPALILADEPTGNLDTHTSQSIMSFLQELNQKGITIVIVTHEEDIANYTKRTVYLRDGIIVQEKTR